MSQGRGSEYSLKSWLSFDEGNYAGGRESSFVLRWSLLKTVNLLQSPTPHRVTTILPAAYLDVRFMKADELYSNTGM
jgi:hypothetical protein